MATTLHSPRPSNGTATLVSEQSYPLRLAATEFDLTDHRYPTLAATPTETNRRSTAGIFSPTNYLLRDQPSHSTDSTQKSRAGLPPPNLPADWTVQGLGDEIDVRNASPEVERKGEVDNQRFSGQSQPPSNDAASPPLPPGAQAARRVTERYSLADAIQTSQPTFRPLMDTPNSSLPWEGARYTPMPSPSPALQSTASQRPSVPGTNGAVEALGEATSPLMAPMTPMATSMASPVLNQTGGFAVPNLSRPRAPAQQPTYVNAGVAQNAMSPMLSNPPAPQEEVCLECAMRDQDMADVDVTSPGIWERESDLMYEDLLRQEREEELAGVVNQSLSRPKAKGDLLTEQNLKLWLTLNPREPHSRQQNLETYVKSQRSLIEAEALAHARAMQESRQLDNMMRDTYSQLRRSAYDMGASAAPIDDTGGVRIKPPNQTGPHARSHSRDVTLLENGMIVEHVDVRKEERERKRKEERREKSRARKSSRSSAVDVTSLYSVQSGGLHTDSGLNQRPNTRYSQSLVGRPASVLTAPPLTDRAPSLPQGYSPGISDAQSLGPPSPRTKFFGFRNMSQSWKSQDSLAVSGMSGSMIDMHLALDGSNNRTPQAPSMRQSQYWPPAIAPPDTRAETKSEKKRGGLAKLWRIFTMNKSDLALNLRNRSTRPEDDGPLAPPPPLSYLMSRGPGDLGGNSPRHASTPSLPSATSPRTALFSPAISSSGTAPSSLVPSPASSRPSATDRDVLGNFGKSPKVGEDHDQPDVDETGKLAPSKTVHSATSENEMRQMGQQNTLGVTSALRPMPFPPPRPHSALIREKSLPPLPNEADSSPPYEPMASPQPTPMFGLRQFPTGQHPRPQTFFATGDISRDGYNRSQSFGGSTARPDLNLRAASQNIAFTQDQRRFPGDMYDEFGNFRSFQAARDSANAPQHESPKRRSKFGLSSLLPKKVLPAQRGLVHQGHTQDHSSARSYDGDDVMSNGYANSASRHSAMSAGARMSVASRKAIDELVMQDREFIAYRYPSGDQGLALQR